jgi:hypothetical protein
MKVTILESKEMQYSVTDIKRLDMARVRAWDTVMNILALQLGKPAIKSVVITHL